MNADVVRWMPGAIVFVVSVLVGVYAARKTSRREGRMDASDDAAEHLAHLLAQLRELEEYRGRYAPEVYQAERRRLETQATSQMAANKPNVEAPTVRAAPLLVPPVSERWQGFLLGLLAMAAVGGLGLLAMRTEVPNEVISLDQMGPVYDALGGEAAHAEVATVKKQLAARPKDIVLQVRLAHSLIEAGRIAEAAAATTAALQRDPNNVEARVHAAVLSGYRDGPEAAIKALNVLLKENPKLAEAWLWHGIFSLRAGHHDDGLRSMRKHLELVHGDPEGIHRAAGIAGGALSPAAGTDSETTIRELQDNLSEQPNDVASLLALSHSLLRHRHIAEAKPFVERALALAPESPEARVHAAMLQAREGNLHGGIAAMKQVTESSPKLAEAWLCLGILASEAGDSSLLQSAWRKYLEVAQDGPTKSRVASFLQGETLQMPW